MRVSPSRLASADAACMAARSSSPMAAGSIRAMRVSAGQRWPGSRASVAVLGDGLVAPAQRGQRGGQPSAALRRLRAAASTARP